VNESASITEELSRGKIFGITLLGRHHENVAAAFSRKPSGRSRFDHGSWRFEEKTVPWLDDAPANLTCVLERSLAYGTHRALIGRVASVRIGPAASSLIYRNGTYF
jgi:flavin reductase (DIM6/NTAB) family NADH-FMN oxidoreductase RutF